MCVCVCGGVYSQNNDFGGHEGLLIVWWVGGLLGYLGDYLVQ